MLELKLADQRTDFRPHEKIRGSLGWSELPESEKSLSIRMIWYTTGKGTRDFETVDSIDLTLPQKTARVDFEFSAPGRPLSFSGRLISLQWAIEVVAFPSKESVRSEFDLSDRTQKFLLEDQSELELKAGFKKPFVHSK